MSEQVGETNCVHGIGHKQNIHGCDGCCNKKGENKMSAVVIAITNEVLDEMERWTFEEYKKFVPNAGNLNWLNNQLKARLELIEHMKHTFGGLK